MSNAILLTYRIVLLCLVFWGADSAHTTMMEQRRDNQTMTFLKTQLAEAKEESAMLYKALSEETTRSDALDEALYQLRMEARMAKGAKRL